MATSYLQDLKEVPIVVVSRRANTPVVIASLLRELAPEADMPTVLDLNSLPDARDYKGLVSTLTGSDVDDPKKAAAELAMAFVEDNLRLWIEAFDLFEVSSESETFFKALGKALKVLVQTDVISTPQLVVTGRTTPMKIWAELIRDNTAVVVNDSGVEVRYTAQMLYNQEGNRRTIVELRVLGGDYYSWVNGVPQNEYDGHQPKDFWLMLVLKGLVTRAEFFEVLWPNLPEKEQVNVFHVTKRKVAEVFDVKLPAKYDSGLYTVDGDKVVVFYDLGDFIDNYKAATEALLNGEDVDWNSIPNIPYSAIMPDMTLPWFTTQRDKYLGDIADVRREQAVQKYNQADSPTELLEAAVYLARAFNLNPVADEPVFKMLVETLLALSEYEMVLYAAANYVAIASFAIAYDIVDIVKSAFEKLVQEHSDNGNYQLVVETADKYNALGLDIPKAVANLIKSAQRQVRKQK